MNRCFATRSAALAAIGFLFPQLALALPLGLGKPVPVRLLPGGGVLPFWCGRIDPNQNSFLVRRRSKATLPGHDLNRLRLHCRTSTGYWLPDPDPGEHNFTQHCPCSGSKITLTESLPSPRTMPSMNDRFIPQTTSGEMFGQPVKRAVAQGHDLGRFPERLESTVAEHLLGDGQGALGARVAQASGGAGLAPHLPSLGLSSGVGGLPGRPTLGLVGDTLQQQPAGQLVLALGDRDLDAPAGGLVDLGRAARSRSPLARRAGVVVDQEALLGELVQVERSQLAGDARVKGDRLTADRSTLGTDKEEDLTAEVVIEHRKSRGVGFQALVHTPNLSPADQDLNLRMWVSML